MKYITEDNYLETIQLGSVTYRVMVPGWIDTSKGMRCLYESINYTYEEAIETGILKEI